MLGYQRPDGRIIVCCPNYHKGEPDHTFSYHLTATPTLKRQAIKTSQMDLDIQVNDDKLEFVQIEDMEWLHPHLAKPLKQFLKQNNDKI